MSQRSTLGARLAAGLGIVLTGVQCAHPGAVSQKAQVTAPLVAPVVSSSSPASSAPNVASSHGSASSSDDLVDASQSRAPCSVDWKLFTEKPLPDETVREWFRAQDAPVPDPLPLCYRTFGDPRARKEGLLCSRVTSTNPEFAEGRLDVYTVPAAHKVHSLSLPVAILPLSGPLCIGSVERQSKRGRRLDESPAPVVQLQAVLGPDGKSLVLRDILGALCWDGVRRIDWLSMYKGLAKETLARVKAIAEPICERRGVYGWRAGKVAQIPNGVVVPKPSTLASVAGGRLPGACVDPISDFLSWNTAVGHDLPQLAESDLDLDGDEKDDAVVVAGAARWQENYLLYVLREGCGYFVGWLTSSEWPRRLPEKSHGLYDLLTSSDECPLANPGEPLSGYCDTIWRFNGSTYVRYREAKTSRQPAGIQP